MQFNSNADFPGSALPAAQWAQVARPPVEFDVADSVPCACITTRVLIRRDDNDAQPVVVGGVPCRIKTAKGVLVRTPTPNHMMRGGSGGGWSDSSSDDEEMPAPQAPRQVHSPSPGPQAPAPPVERAYWLRRTLRAAIYGKVKYGIILNKLNPPIQVMLPATNEWVTVEWEETNEPVAVKEMSWEHIRAQRNKLAEDPIKEVAAMQYLSKWLVKEQQIQKNMEMLQSLQQSLDVNAQLAGMAGMNLSSTPLMNGGGMGGYVNGSNPQQQQLQQQVQQMQQQVQQRSQTPLLSQTPQNMLESHIMMPLDLLSDDRNLYSVMPYCKDGELFDVLEKKNRFSEPEARFWMRQILKGLTCLKKAGVNHRDLSLENLLVHEGNVLVIDMGMCLRVPFVEGGAQRYLILPQGVCGKWHYMSPEVCKNQLPFDGPAVDLWAAGVILFLMLTGFPPWERPMLTDERFKYMSNGYLVQMLTEWGVGLSADAMDLLQRMFWLDPTDRLSLEQVCAHPWMQIQG